MKSMFDFTTVIKAYQALSSEIELDQLLLKLMKVVMENAGADRGVLLLPKQEQWQIAVLCENAQTCHIKSTILNENSPVSFAIIQTVKRSLEVFVSDDIDQSPLWKNDPYLLCYQPQSVLCSPILKQDKIVGILYLENHVTMGAFNRDRVDLLNILCTQAAISIENARLYSQMQENQRQLMRLLSNLPGMAYSCANDEHWTMHLVSEGCYELTGYYPKEFLNNHSISYAMLIHPDDVEMVDQIVQNALQSHQPFHLSYRIQTKNGAEKWVWEKGQGVFDEVGNLLKLEGLAIDITDRKVAEKLIQEKNEALENALTQLQQSQTQVIQAEKMSALGNLVAGVAHEINNPVGFLKGNLQPALDYIQDLFSLIDFYQKQFPDSTLEIEAEVAEIDLEFMREDLPQLITSMNVGIERIKNISTSLRTFSRADSDQPVSFDLHEGIDSTLLILKHRFKANDIRPEIQIIKNYGQVQKIEGYAGQLNQVFMNILANSIDAIDQSCETCKKIDFYCQTPKTITITTQYSESQQTVLISLKDNGIGMSETVKAKIFEHLFTTKGVGKGTGLGLAIAHQIVVEKHQGSITVNSAPNAGTEFIITLPLQAPINRN